MKLLLVLSLLCGVQCPPTVMAAVFPLAHEWLTVLAFSGEDVVLRCPSAPPRVFRTEWLERDGGGTVHVQREGRDLDKEQLERYRGRTVLRDHVHLELRAVQKDDSRTFQCKVKPERETAELKENFVTLVIVDKPEVRVNLERTGSHQLRVRCSSSGWSPVAVHLLLKDSTEQLKVQRDSNPQPDGLFSVSALLDLLPNGGSVQLTCRLELLDRHLQSNLTVTDSSDSAHPCCWISAIFCSCLLLSLLLNVVVLLRGRAQRWRWYQRLSGSSSWSDADAEEDHFDTRYRELSTMSTSGASEATARNHCLIGLAGGGGVEASVELAQRDAADMENFMSDIISVGREAGLHPAIIAAIISRQSRAGTLLNSDGFGLNDDRCFGIMQINRMYHVVDVSKGARSYQHIQQGAQFLRQLILTMWRMKENRWTKEQRLKGALASYIAGEDKVIPLTDPEDVDLPTPYGDFSADVIARAQWFAQSGYTLP